jgi:hypothetical protein
MDPIAFGKNIRLHARVPLMSTMTEVNTTFQQSLHGNNRHTILLFFAFFPPPPSILDGAIPQANFARKLTLLPVLARAARSGDVSDIHPKGWCALLGTIAEYITTYADSSKENRV